MTSFVLRLRIPLEHTSWRYRHQARSVSRMLRYMEGTHELVHFTDIHPYNIYIQTYTRKHGFTHTRTHTHTQTHICRKTPTKAQHVEKGRLSIEGDMDLCSYARVWVNVCATRVRWV